jgi:hydrogenase expression/formation protein HypD
LLDNRKEVALGKEILPQLILLAQKAARQLGRLPVFMEVCGTHTMVIARSGLRSLLAGYLELRSGPGCPVCVTGQEDIDRVILLARQPSVVIATFGDMLRVPGTISSLEQERACQARVKIAYSPAEAVTYAAEHPENTVVFLGVGFETTAPAIALSIAAAKNQGLSNYTVLSLHKLVPPVIKALLNDPETGVDGFLLPGHVATIIGREAFDFVAAGYRVPAVIAGFEPVDIMIAIYLLLKQILSGQAQTINGYPRLVQEKGNKKAKAIIKEYFELADVTWRGFGPVPQSGLRFKELYSLYDAATRYPLTVPFSSPPKGCACADVLKGKINSPACPLFADACTPLKPLGPCMVSSEGSCAAYYQYGWSSKEAKT